MCGILFIFNHEYEVDQSVLKQRGPDSSKTIYTNNCACIFHRLRIMDNSDQGDQPMVSGSVTMMCNGEIYNYRELIDEYELECKSHSDCEVILHLYQKIGFVEMYKKLDGVFAIVLIDGDNIWVARDRVGVRPLFVGGNNNKVRGLCSLAGPLTKFCNQVEPILPNVCFSFSKSDDLIISKYIGTIPLYTDNPETHSFGNNITKLNDILSQAVKRQAVADRPIGCLLSGGLDSSIIATLLVRLLGANNVNTYSIGMEDSIDVKYAEKMAAFLRTKHTTVRFTPQQGLDVIPKVIKALESYDVTTVRASVGMYLLCEYISKNTTDKVIFSGEGSDELFCGYLYFHNAPTPLHASDESRRLVSELYLYDVLRADRTVSCHGLELRVPFLDTKIVDFALSLPSTHKSPINKWEKYMLRKAFETYLPKEIVWRRKNGFSDGVGSVKKPWYSYIQDFVNQRLADELFDETKYLSKEAMYYKLIFTKEFPTYDPKIEPWLPKWSGDIKNPSGMLMGAFDENDTDK